MSDPVRVLHVDDDAEFAALTATVLEREAEGFAVETAASAAAGLDRVDDVDCLVSDYDMPGMDGIEFLETVREEHPDLPFILFTGKGSEEVASEALRKGATDYLRKGGGAEQYDLLANRIRNAVEQYRATQRAVELSRIRTLVNDVNQALVRASSRAEVETGVCETISEAAPYVAAWIGDVDTGTGQVVPRVKAGVEDCALANATLEIDATTDSGPVGTAVRERRIAVSQGETGGSASGERGDDDDRGETRHRVGDSGDPVGDPRDGTVTDRDVRATAAVPLEHDGLLFGVLVVYADGADAFDDGERSLLGELGDDIAHALHSVRTQQELAETSAKLQALFDQSPDIVNVHDAEGTIVESNERLFEKTGYEEREVTGMKLWEINQSVDREDVRAVLERMDPGDRERLEGVYQRRDGSTFPVEIHVRRLAIEDGDRFVAINRDITERKERTRKLERQNERLEEFASVVSHDLRNPLNVARGRLDLARDECDSPHLADVADAHERMESLIENLLVLAREGEEVREPVPTDLAALVDTCRSTVETAGATVRVETDLTLRADRNRLQQALENLLRNAVEHGSTSPPSQAPEDAAGHGSDGVTVTVGDLEDADGFYVADDGPGIPDADREQVFESGYSTTADGTGFGLAIVREIVEAHGWTIRVTDSADGGARFEITGVDVA